MRSPDHSGSCLKIYLLKVDGALLQSQRVQGLEFTAPSSGVRLVALSGALLLIGYMGLFVLLESPTLWVYPTLVQDRWPGFFGSILNLFPREWIGADRTSALGLLNASLYFVLLAWLFGVYLFVLRRVFSLRTFSATLSQRAFRVVFAFTVGSMLVLLFVRGMFSTDIFNYIWYGRIFGIFGGNPFTDLAVNYSAVDTGHWLKYGIYLDRPNVYGPAWVMLVGAIAWVAQAGDGNIANHLMGNRLLMDVVHLVNIWLVWRVAGLVIPRYWRSAEGSDTLVTEESWQQAARVGVTVAYAWNPLLIIEFGVSGHNDLLIVTCVLAGVWLHLRGRWRLATLALALAGLMKFSGLLFLPGYLWLIFWRGGDTEHDAAINLRERLWRLAQALAIVLAAYLVCFAPFESGPISLTTLSLVSPGTSGFNHSLGKILVFKLTEGLYNAALGLNWQPSQSWDLDHLREAFDPFVRVGLLFIVAVLSIWATWRARTIGRMLLAWGLVLLIYLTVGSFWFWPWYVSWVVAPVALAGPGRLWNATIILCACSMTLYALFPAGAVPLAPLVGWTGLIFMAPPLAYMLFSRRPLFEYWVKEA